jgi:hypothetical protein
MREIINNGLYKCSECKAIVAGRELDWFDSEPDTMFICPACNNRCGIEKVDGEAEPMVRRVTITDENGIVLDEFVVSNEDAKRITDGFSTDWMDKQELKEYLEEDA